MHRPGCKRYVNWVPALVMAFQGSGWLTSPPPPDVEFRFDAHVLAPQQARQAVAAIAGDGRTREAVLLATSELVSNVIRHTHGGGTLWGWNSDPLRLEVYDSSPTLPDRLGARLVGGLGLRLVDHLCVRWGSQPVASGKVVWAEVARTQL